MSTGLVALAGGLASAGVAALVGSNVRKRRRQRNIETTSKLIQHWASIFGISPEIPMVITGIESDFDPATENHNDRAEKVGGAWGLMQVTLVTAGDEIGKIKAKAIDLDPSIKIALAKWNGSGKSLLDPFLNTMLGTWYLAGLAKELGNDFDLVTAAYQQGPKYIKAALDTGKSKAVILAQVIGDKGREYVAMAQKRRDELRQQAAV